MTERPYTPLLDQVHEPADLNSLSDAELHQLAEELRAETISVVSETGGHLGAGLGVIELTVALHAVFQAPKDKLIWDVSHQSYPPRLMDVLINLTPIQPDFFSQFKRVIEVIAPNDNDKVSARERYRFYQSRGYEIQTHQL